MAADKPIDIDSLDEDTLRVARAAAEASDMPLEQWLAKTLTGDSNAAVTSTGDASSAETADKPEGADEAAAAPPPEPAAGSGAPSDTSAPDTSAPDVPPSDLDGDNPFLEGASDDTLAKAARSPTPPPADLPPPSDETRVLNIGSASLAGAAAIAPPAGAAMDDDDDATIIAPASMTQPHVPDDSGPRRETTPFDAPAAEDTPAPSEPAPSEPAPTAASASVDTAKPPPSDDDSLLAAIASLATVVGGQATGSKLAENAGQIGVAALTKNATPAKPAAAAPTPPAPTPPTPTPPAPAAPRPAPAQPVQAAPPTPIQAPPVQPPQSPEAMLPSDREEPVLSAVPRAAAGSGPLPGPLDPAPLDDDLDAREGGDDVERAMRAAAARRELAGRNLRRSRRPGAGATWFFRPYAWLVALGALVIVAVLAYWWTRPDASFEEALADVTSIFSSGGDDGPSLADGDPFGGNADGGPSQDVADAPDNVPSLEDLTITDPNTASDGVADVTDDGSGDAPEDVGTADGGAEDVAADPDAIADAAGDNDAGVADDGTAPDGTAPDGDLTDLTVEIPDAIFTEDGASAADALQDPQDDVVVPADVEAQMAAAAGGDTDAQVALAERYLAGDGVAEDAAEGIRLLEQAAASNNVTAQARLGEIYQQGIGTEPDPFTAALWYMSAAERGDPEARLALGQIYRAGEGLPASDTEAARWFRLAADDNLAAAEYELGLLYLNGLGLPQSPTLAHVWLSRAANHGFPGAAEKADEVAISMTPDMLEEARRISVDPPGIDVLPPELDTVSTGDAAGIAPADTADVAPEDVAPDDTPDEIASADGPVADEVPEGDAVASADVVEDGAGEIAAEDAPANDGASLDADGVEVVAADVDGDAPVGDAPDVDATADADAADETVPDPEFIAILPVLAPSRLTEEEAQALLDAEAEAAAAAEAEAAALAEAEAEAAAAAEAEAAALAEAEAEAAAAAEAEAAALAEAEAEAAAAAEAEAAALAEAEAAAEAELAEAVAAAAAEADALADELLGETSDDQPLDDAAADDAAVALEDLLPDDTADAVDEEGAVAETDMDAAEVEPAVDLALIPLLEPTRSAPPVVETPAPVIEPTVVPIAPAQADPTPLVPQEPAGQPGGVVQGAATGSAISPAAIQEIQQLLIAAGYNIGSADGVVGPSTVSAVSAYQADQGIPITGRVTLSLLARLRTQ